MKIQGIYKIVNKINNKIYIGQSINIEERFKQHKRSLNKYLKYPLYRAFKKYGIENFEFIIIEEVINIRDLDQREQYWLDHYQSYLPKKGYNLAIGAKGVIHSEESKKKISLNNSRAMLGKQHTEEAKQKMRINRNRNRSKMSEETKLKISLSHKGKPSGYKGKRHSKETKEKISLYMTGKKRGKYKNKLVLFKKAI
mgnify:CR=1 FL=1